MAEITGIKAIAFDTDGTLVDFERVMRHSLGVTLRELEKHRTGVSLKMDIETMIKIRDSIADECEGKITSHEDIRLESFRRILSTVRISDESLAVQLYRLYMKHRYEDIEIFDDVLPVLQVLKGRYKLGLHSNGNSYPELCGLAGYFDFTVFSQDCMVKKPEPAFYRIVLEKAGCSSGELLNVGDSLHNDVVGAAESGIRGVWLNRKRLVSPLETPVEHEIYSLREILELLTEG